MGGQKPLRVGLVMLGGDRKLATALPEPGASPGGAAPVANRGALYCERVLSPESLPTDGLSSTIAELGAFTDVVPLAFDGRGVVSYEGMVQRLQDRVWPVAVAQELDALLVIEGVRDAGLHWSSAGESVFSLDTVLWWLTWPFGGWIPDRDYGADAAIVAHLYSVGDPRPTPERVDASATVGSISLHPWERASVPTLCLLLPPAWVADDEAAVAASVGSWTESMLPVELVRRLKQMPFANAADTQLVARCRDGRIELQVESNSEVTEAVVTALPRGALVGSAVAVPVPLRTRLEPTAKGSRHFASGEIPMVEFADATQSLLRARVTLASGDSVSQTWTWLELQRSVGTDLGAGPGGDR